MMKEQNILKRKIISKVKVSFFVFIFFSCQVTLEKKMEGLWIIKEIRHNQKNYLDSLSINTLTFRGNNRISLPNRIKYNDFDEDIWSIDSYKNSDTMIIKSSNKLFNGNYLLLFSKDPEDLSVYAKLISKHTVLVLHKVDFTVF